MMVQVNSKAVGGLRAGWEQQPEALARGLLLAP